MTQLELKQIQKSFEVGTVNEHHVLKGINLSLKAGEFVTVIGGNGAGKSTLMNSITGAVTVDSGEVWIAGRNVTNWSVPKRAGLVGYVFQDPRMGTATNLTVQENLALANKRGLKRHLGLGVKHHDREWMQEQLAMLDLNLEHRLDVEMGLLSGGQRQAITLLMAMLRQPELLLLDEHTAALDPKTSEVVLHLTEKMIAQHQLTTLMITHNMEDALKYGNRLIMLHQGEIMLDIDESTKKGMTVVELLELFKEKVSAQPILDSMVLG